MCRILVSLPSTRWTPQEMAQAVIAGEKELPAIPKTQPAPRPDQQKAKTPSDRKTGVGTAQKGQPVPSTRAQAPAAKPAAVSPARSPVPQETQTGTGTVARVHDHHLTIDLDGGGRVNCLLSRWLIGGGVPREGIRLKCRYAPGRHQVLEILNMQLPPDLGTGSSESAAGRQKLGCDLDYLNERLREGHRYEIMAFLREHCRQGHIEWYQMRPAVHPRHGKPKHPLAKDVLKAIQSETDFSGFYLHQARALDAIRARRNLLLVTQTASGKTLCYNPGIFEDFRQLNGNQRALYVFPLRALLMDQKGKIDRFCEHFRKLGLALRADILVGGLGQNKRYRIANSDPHIICTTPEMLNTMLQDFRKGYWHRFLAGLRFVVIDEAHLYHGLLGVHGAGLVRRLLLTARRCKAEPQFILSSATIRDPLDLAVRLTSLLAPSFEVLDEVSDGSAQQAKHWAAYSPDAGISGDDYNGYLGAAASAMVDLLCATDDRGRRSPLNTILFAKSMRDVSNAYAMVVRNLEKRRPDLVGKVRRYISAVLGDKDKREIYEGLRNERYVGVVSTNALEAGIDIGRLDACIIAGFPFTVMRMRQMAGRVGRQDEGLVLFVPNPANPVDEYYRYDPQLLLTQKPEAFVIDADNPYIMRKHLNAAAYHLNGISMEEAQMFGSRLDEMVAQAVKRRIMQWYPGRLRGTYRHYKHLDDVYAIHNIRSNVQRPYAICLESDTPCRISPTCLSSSVRKKDRCPHRISVVDQQYVYRDAHPGAVYEAGDKGKLYRILAIDEESYIAKAKGLPDHTMERTFADETTNIELSGSPQGSRKLSNGAMVAWGKARVTRSFDGYYSYTLIPARRCRRCRREFEERVERCPTCGRGTEVFFRHSKPEYREFPSPYNEKSFTIPLDTMGAWLTIPAELEARLYDASPCKLPGEQNRVLAFLQKPLDMGKPSKRLHLIEDERRALLSYHKNASQELPQRWDKRGGTLLLPGTYGQCLLRALRRSMPEGRALEIFAAVTGYPVTDDLRHVCRNCRTSVLLPAMHTVEHTVVMRYPSVALGHWNDLISHTTLGHPSTGGPTVFWFDSYEGGIGAAEKVFDRIEELLEASWDTLHRCNCTTMEGCPYCTQVAHCDRRNEALSKPAGSWLIDLLLGRDPAVGFGPFVYRRRDREAFERTYAENEYVTQVHGIGQEAPTHAPPITLDPYDLLRIQRMVHACVLHKAFEVRSAEITNEVPPVSAVELQEAYRKALSDSRSSGWHLTLDMTPYLVLEVQATATTRMISRIYRVIVRQLHPDVNPGRRGWATRMMQIVNNAYDKIRKARISQLY